MLDDDQDLPCDCADLVEESPLQKVEVLKILGEGSQGVVALCRYSDLPKHNKLDKNRDSPSEE